MTNKRTPAKKRSPNQLDVVLKPGEEKAAMLARTYTDPIALAGTTLMRYSTQFDGVELQSLVTALTVQSKTVIDGDLSRAEHMLTAQAHTLDAIFNKLARMAIDCDMLNQLEGLLRLALKAQSQSRATWEAVAGIKNPPLAAFVGQANIAHNQQVNNGAAPKADTSRTREIGTEQTQLSGRPDELLPDTRASGNESQVNPALETLGEIDGAKVRRG